MDDTESSSFGFPSSGSPQRESLLYEARSTSSPSLAPTIFMSSITKSFHLHFGLFLLPVIAISISLFPTYPSLLFTCPYQRNLAPRRLSGSFAIFAVPLIYSFFILFFILSSLLILSLSHTRPDDTRVYVVHVQFNL